MSSSTAQAWDGAPCGLLVVLLDGEVVEVNRTFLSWVGRDRDAVVGQPLARLLSVGGRIFWETHLRPLLHVEGRLDEVALELATPDGRRPVLLSAERDDDLVRIAVTGAAERTRYERQLVASRASAERNERRVRQLQGTTAALSSALGVRAVADALAAAACGPLGAAAATVWLSGADSVLSAHGADEVALPAVPPPSSVGAPTSAHAVDGQVVVPLRGQVWLQGVLVLDAPSDAGAEPLDLEVLTAVGQQAGLALDRAHRYEQSASVAHELQHALLAVAPPVDDRFAVASAYRPGVELLEVGGDWHDAFLAHDSVLSFVVGDVVGRGLRAAGAMGQLSSAVRALAGPDLGPARLLSRLDHFVEQVEAAGMATLVYAELDLDTGVVRYACAGHPPPLLLPARGTPRLLWEGRSTPLGAFLRPQLRQEAELQLEPGDRLLLYTDGLVERRDRSLDDGLDLLVAAAESVGPVPLEESVRVVTELLLQDEVVRDDVCVLQLSWTGAEFARDLSADLSGLSALRSALRTWLAGRGVPDDVRDDLVLAASEVTANAAEHGCDREPEAQVHVRARVEQTGTEPEVVVAVRDPGRWRTRVASSERGRGLRIVRSLVDDVRVDTGRGTTVVLRRRAGSGTP